MLNRLVSNIRRKSRDQWQREALAFVEQMRVWIQVNGELSALIAFVAGIAIVLEFRIFLTLLVLFAAAGFVVWQVAVPEGRADTNAEGKREP